MAREATITFEQVATTADSIKASGGKPTARAVRDVLGTGSMATVLKLLQQWQAGQVRQSQAIDDTLDPGIARAISNQIAAKVQEATADAIGRLADLQAEADALIAENERQAAENEAQAAELAAIQEQHAALAGRAQQLAADAARTVAELAAERQASEAARVELAKAELRLEAVPRIEAEIERVRAELAAERQQRAEAEKQAASSKAEAQAKAERYDDGVKGMARATAAHQAELDRMQGFIAQASSDAKQARDALARATELLTNAQAQRADEGQKAAARIGALEGTIAALEKGITYITPP